MERVKRYLIIGGSSETGIAFLRLLEDKAEKGLAPEKIEILAHYNSQIEPLKELADTCRHLSFEFFQCDLSDGEQVEQFADRLKQEAPVQALIYLPAGKLHYEKLKKMQMDSLDRNYQIQVRALARISQVVLPLMAKEKFGKAVVMLSECTLGMPPKFMAEYVTVKYGALGLMRALSMEYADKNINVNGISPAMMETRFLSEVDSRLVEMNADANVKRRNVTVTETAEAIAFLVSKGSDYMNGVNLNFTGGNQV